MGIGIVYIGSLLHTNNLGNWQVMWVGVQTIKSFEGCIKNFGFRFPFMLISKVLFRSY